MIPVTKQLHRTLELVKLTARRGLAGKLWLDTAGDQRFLDPFSSPPCMIPLPFGKQSGKALIIH